MQDMAAHSSTENQQTVQSAPGIATDIPQHIVHVVRQFHPSTGGLEDFVDQLTAEQINIGHKVTIVTCDSVFADGKKLAATNSHNGRHIIRVPWRGSTKYPVAPKVLKHIADADIVHVHAIDFFFDFLAATRLLHRKPMVATTHGGFFHTQDLAAVKKVWFNTLTRFSIRQYERIIGCSNNDKRNFEALGTDNVISIDNGVNIEKFRDSASKTPVKRMITLGRFSKNKRVDNLVAMMAELDDSWMLDIVGAPSDWSGDDILQMIASHGVEDRVKLHVKPSNEEITRIMSKCSYFVSASEFEGFGLAVVEAMSAGLVPILHNNPTFVDLGAKHPPIALADFGDAKSAARVVTECHDTMLASGGDLRAEMIERAEEYSWSSVAAKYGEAYAAVLAE
jgi:alpha-1,3-mannosyltransferase